MEVAPTVSGLYVGVIVLLTFTQDEAFCATAFQHLVVPEVPWYEERFMRHVSLGSLAVLVLLRTLVHTLARLNDFYLVEVKGVRRHGRNPFPAEAGAAWVAAPLCAWWARPK